ncbi:low molecular weight phosphatase family protein [Corynebacterium kroppenstedtii]|uniref:protein-tyrosine-phosphatase n=1 Tax=Corynebacterium kroppenstedtii (strain DSM 44385 / JCM 11950 / CIP 105744 / CCUG 35717) TaxID=645127 RepID=C4LLU1_CORK4|nr:low molecular weight phosphatase family protein [Corynebacterium kroppenstedtii]ACR16867.1 putative phosphotyrosine protein phosphatase [Corynebacterium kroppenstedtii DSM 44385]QRP09836.1 low molecular weight phosphatase family protein [Corynebacterium kroppenstedtii]
MKIVFVCTGNQCRSPVAEYVARSFANELAAQAKTKGPQLADSSSLTLEFASAGTHAHRGTPMDPRALRFLAAEGINSDGFSSTRLNRAALAGADIVVGMETAHVEHALRIAPTLLKKAATLRQLAAWSTIDSVHFPDDIAHLRATRAGKEILDAHGPDIPDPAAGNDDDFMRISREVRDDIKALVKAFVNGQNA